MKVRAWDIEGKCWIPQSQFAIFADGRDQFLSYNEDTGYFCFDNIDIIREQFTGLHDKNGKEIYQGDILEFSDKWEWYRGSYGIKMHFASGDMLAKLQKEYEAEPMERRAISIPGDYEWLLSTEIQEWWSVIGNIHENNELLETT